MRVRTYVRLLSLGRALVPVTTGLVIAIVLTLANGSLDYSASTIAALSLAGALAMAWAYPRIAGKLRSRLLFRRNSQLLASLHDPKRLRRVFDDITDGYRVLGLTRDLYWELTSALVLMEEGRWSEARAVHESIDPAVIEHPADLILHENNFAWVLAHDGAPGEAVALAGRALARVPAANDGTALLASVNGTLGAALTLDGRHAEAIASLRRAIDLGGSPPDQAIRRYYLGVALLALGEMDEARHALEQARAEAPFSRWGRLAAQRLAAEMPPPYRGTTTARDQNG